MVYSLLLPIDPLCIVLYIFTPCFFHLLFGWRNSEFEFILIYKQSYFPIKLFKNLRCNLVGNSLNVMQTRHRSWCFTVNNPTADEEALYRLVNGYKYYVFSREKGELGTWHLQGYVTWTSPRTLTATRKLLPRAHLSVARGTAKQNRDYCLKDLETDDHGYYEDGKIPSSPEAQGDPEKERWEEAWKAAKLGDIESIPADIRIRSYTTLKRITQDYMPQLADLDGPCGVWIHGAAGTGKTRSVVEAYPECYRKPRNLWWDGYRSEPVVLLDDVDVYDVKLGGSLKHWADCYAFIGEFKGGSRRIRPQKLIVTSQYHIDEIWSDVPTRQALHRRFQLVHKLENFPIEI